MKAVGYCVLIVIILCIIGVLLWLYLRRKKTNGAIKGGGGMKMKGGGPVDELQRAIFILTANINPSANPKPNQDEVNRADIILSDWLSAVRNGVSIDGNDIPDNVVDTALTLVSNVMSYNNPYIILPVLSACMKNPYAHTIANRIHGIQGIVKSYQDRVDTDYLARAFFIFIGDDKIIDNMIIEDIKDSGNAIKQVIECLVNNANISAVSNIATRIIANTKTIIVNVDKPIHVKNLVSCLMYIYNNVRTLNLDIAHRAALEANAIYKAATDPVIAWLCADEISDLEIFQLRPDTVNTDFFYILAKEYTGEVDFEYITKHDGVSATENNAIYVEQVKTLMRAINESNVTLIYDIASELVTPV